MTKSPLPKTFSGFCAAIFFLAIISIAHAAGPKVKKFGIGNSTLIHLNCEAYFGYLEYTVHRPGGQNIPDFLKLPAYIDVKPGADDPPQPRAELQRAMEYAARYVPTGPEARKGTPISHHRAYILKSMFIEISRVYPHWSARLYRNSSGDFIFSGDGIHYVKVSDPEGVITSGKDLYAQPE